jgi:ketosteroid isomerase-like protein
VATRSAEVDAQEAPVSDQELTQRFIDALHALEGDRDLETIVRLYSPQSEIGNIVSPRQFSGVDGAREFWTSYRSTFGTAESSFRNVIVGDGRAALEWTTTGTSADGDPFTYSGVSILELADGRITRFWAYFDPHSLGQQIENPARVAASATRGD